MPLQPAYYTATISSFLASDASGILGDLNRAHGFSLEPQQRDAWLAEITVMKGVLEHVETGHVLFEFAIPRLGKRADVIVISGGVVLVIEFKVGSDKFERGAIEQVHDYALDLKNFHRGSHRVPIIPILVATSAENGQSIDPDFASDMVATPILADSWALQQTIEHSVNLGGFPRIEYSDWATSGYQPTPTIVQAAQALYQDHQVEEIARSDAGAQNLSATTDCISAIIERSKAEGRKTICLVTGVPGAGKTLAGLNIATKRRQEHSDEHAVFLSGNGPLVAVLREALARDETAREGIPKKDALRKVASFVQNIHHFRDEALRDRNPPYERVVVFDEAQRAWTRDQTSKFMQSKRQISDFGMSEPEFLISVMDRHKAWCVVVCLVGGGQEINTGEAGLAEWLNALGHRFADWHIYISDRLADADYVSDAATADLLQSLPTHEEKSLHLAISMRSFRAEALSSFVGHVVENRASEALATYTEIADRYPIWLTRDLNEARRWLRGVARGSERFGLLASSGAYRLRPEGLHVKAQIDAPNWFLNEPSDVRSSYYCEEVATEFDVQGLELDWAAVCWDADFRYQDGEWRSFNFRGTRWQRANTADSRLYRKNAYRVLLTRARQGMIIFVPFGSTDDPTRPPEFYDDTIAFLQACGVRDLAGAPAAINGI